MKINPALNLPNSQIQPTKKTQSSFKSSAPFAGIKPSLQNLQANFMPMAISFKGDNITQKIAPPQFENELVNEIFSRNTDVATIKTKDAKHRSESCEILSKWYTDIGISMLQDGTGIGTIYNDVSMAGYDNASFEEHDKYFMYGIQRLVDCGAIDDKTFVLIDTGHSIPMGAQLMKEENKQTLGDVKGTFLLGESAFPKKHPNADKNDEWSNDIYETTMLKGNNSRLSSQALTYGDIIEEANKDNKGGNGAVFLGVDFHRNAKLDTSKLPTAQELKALGLNRVVVVQEYAPVSSFANDADRVYNPITTEKAQRALSYFLSACEESQKTPPGGKISEQSKEEIKKHLMMAARTLKAPFADKMYLRLDTPNKKQTAELIEQDKFGMGTNACLRNDVTQYLEQLKRDSEGALNIIVEGSDLIKLRQFPLERLQQGKDLVAEQENKNFEHALMGNFMEAFAHLVPKQD